MRLSFHKDQAWVQGKLNSNILTGFLLNDPRVRGYHVKTGPNQPKRNLAPFVRMS